MKLLRRFIGLCPVLLLMFICKIKLGWYDMTPIIFIGFLAYVMAWIDGTNYLLRKRRSEKKFDIILGNIGWGLVIGLILGTIFSELVRMWK